MNRREYGWLVRLSLTILCVFLVSSTTVGATMGAGDDEFGPIEQVTVAFDGNQPNDMSLWFSLSEDGRFVAFGSYASNLVIGDTNDYQDVFVRDRQSGVTERVSVRNNGSEGYPRSMNNVGMFPAISADGRFVAFTSVADLVEGLQHNGPDVFLRDRTDGVTELISVSSDGIQANGWSSEPAISADGRFVAFSSHGNNLIAIDRNSTSDVFLRDRLGMITERITVGYSGEDSNGPSYGTIAITPDGRFIAFTSRASNIVENDTNQYDDVFVWDGMSRTTERVSISTTGQQANNWSMNPSISADGRFIAFMSEASNLVENDTNQVWDVFVHDRQSRQTERVSISSSGEQAPRGYWSSHPSISGDGRYVAFRSGAGNLVPGDRGGWDVFIRDRIEYKTVLASQVDMNNPVDHSDMYPAITSDGRYVAFDTAAVLVAGDSNGDRDIFIRATPFRPKMTFEALCDLSRSLVSKPGIGSSLCAKLHAASEAQKRWQLDVRRHVLTAFEHQVKAQIGKALTLEEASQLLDGVRELQGP